MSADFQSSDEQVTAHAKRLLDRSMADLDPAITHRLQRARQTALQARPIRRWMVLTGGLAMAAVAAITITLTLRSTQPMPEHHAASLVEDMDLVLSAENVELADDLEFYHWLADVDTTG